MSATAEMPTSEAPFEAQQLAEWLVKGKPELGWPGDPRLSLHIGVLTAAHHGFDRRHSGNFFRKGDVVAYRYEVWRHNEDGTDTEIIHREAKDWHTIVPELARLRMGGPAAVDTHAEVVKHNDKVHEERSADIRDAMGEHLDHLWRLVADRQNGKTTFRGLPGRNPEKQA